MKEKLNSIICELENINDELATQERSIDNQVSDIEYSIRNLNDISSELYDLRTQVYNIQTDISEILNELEEKELTTKGYTLKDVSRIVEIALDKYFNVLQTTPYTNIISESISVYNNSQTEERDEL